MQRLDKYLTLALGITRSEAKTYLTKGWIAVNDNVVKKGDIKIDENKDIVTCQGKQIGYEEMLYYMLNKAAGYVSATVDDKYPTIISIFDEKERKRLFPVGRLDIDTEGLIIVTNDGALNHHLTSPKHNIVKKYYAKLKGIPDLAGIDKIHSGIDLGDFVAKAADLELISSNEMDNTSEVYVYVSEGKFHQVKRMMSAIGTEVIYLKRVAIGELLLDETIEVGNYRKLTDKELEILRK